MFYEGTKTDAPSATATEATGKSEGYRNEYVTCDLEFGKEVKGNFGSLDQYFEFTVVLGNMAEGTVLNVDLSDADATPHASDANEVTTADNPTSLTVGADGTVTQKFYIHDGQYIVIKGEQLLGCLSLQQRPDSFSQQEVIAEHFWLSLEIDSMSLSVEIVHVVEKTGSSSTTTDDDILKLSHLMEHGMLYLPKPLLAPLDKQLRHTLAHAALDIPIEVIEREAGLF